MGLTEEILPELKRERDYDGRLPRDFWENLRPANYNNSLVRDQPGAIISYDSHTKALNITAKRDDLFDKPRYHVTITDNEVALEALSKDRSPLDSPGFIVGSKTFQDFDVSMGIFFAAHQKLNELGY